MSFGEAGRMAMIAAENFQELNGTGLIVGEALRFQSLFFHGRPRDRKMDSSPKCFAVDCTHSSLPYGWLRVTLRRMASNSPSVCG